MIAESALYEIARWQGIAWTFVDALCVALVLACLDIVRRREGRSRAWLRWALLAFSLALSPLVFLAPGRREFFRSEVAVVSLHFAALLLSLIDIPRVLAFLRRLEASSQSETARSHASNR